MNDPTEDYAGYPGQPEAGRRPVRRALMVLRFIAVFVAVGLAIVLTLQNKDDVTLQFLLWTVTLSRALLLFIVLVVGALIGWLLRSALDDDGFRPFG
ncbi:MAG: LapA family protein [Dehalococcoidia bacterium]